MPSQVQRAAAQVAAMVDTTISASCAALSCARTAVTSRGFGTLRRGGPLRERGLPAPQGASLYTHTPLHVAIYSPHINTSRHSQWPHQAAVVGHARCSERVSFKGLTHKTQVA